MNTKPPSLCSGCRLKDLVPPEAPAFRVPMPPWPRRNTPLFQPRVYQALLSGSVQSPGPGAMEGGGPELVGTDALTPEPTAPGPSSVLLPCSPSSQLPGLWPSGRRGSLNPCTCVCPLPQSRPPCERFSWGGSVCPVVPSQGPRWGVALKRAAEHTHRSLSNRRLVGGGWPSILSAHAHTYAHTRAHAHTRAYTRTRTRACIHTHTRTHIQMPLAKYGGRTVQLKVPAQHNDASLPASAPAR